MNNIKYKFKIVNMHGPWYPPNIFEYHLFDTYALYRCNNRNWWPMPLEQAKKSIARMKINPNKIEL